MKKLLVIGLLFLFPVSSPAAGPDYSKPPEAKGKFARMWDGRRWDDYWVMMWIMGTSFQQKLVEQVFWKMREMGCNAGMVYRNGSDEWPIKFFMPYYDENMYRLGYTKQQ